MNHTELKAALWAALVATIIIAAAVLVAANLLDAFGPAVGAP